MVKESRKLKHGDLTEPIPAKSARYISNTTVEIIQSFYQSDEVYRNLPGKKNFVSVKVNNLRIHKQKCLLLMNLNELCQAFKKDNPEIMIGISKFCELRPKNRITVGSHGSHSVCLCKIHQNVKLMIALQH